MLRRSEFEELVRAHAGAVYRAARRVVSDDAGAQDVVSEVYLAVLKRPATYLDREDPGAALRWLAVKKGLEALRRKRARSRHEEESEAMDDAGGAGDAPLDRVEHAEEKAALRGALEALPDELRVAVVLRFQEGWTLKAIAAATEVSEPSVHDRVRRAIEKLRARLFDLGFAAAARAIETEVAAVEPPPVPVSLATKLTALHGAAASGVSTLGVLGGGVLLAVSSWLTVVAMRSDGGSTARGPERRTAIADSAPSPSYDSGDATVKRELVAEGATSGEANPRTDAIDDTNPPAAAPRSVDDFSKMQRGTIVGRVRVAEADAHLLTRIDVVASSLRHFEKGAVPTWRTAVRADGRYELEVPIEDDGAYFHLWIEYDSAILTFAPDVRGRPKSRVEAPDIVFDESLGETPGEYDLEAILRDRAGEPIADQFVVIDRLFDYAGEAPCVHQESHSKTDSQGRVRFHGTILGRKRIELVAGIEPSTKKRFDFAIAIPGPSTREISFPELVLAELRVEAPAPPAESPRPEIFLEGSAFDAVTNAPHLSLFPDVRAIAIGGDLTDEQIRADVIPNVLFGGTPVQVLIDGDATPSDRFHEVVALPGRYLLVLTAQGRAPAIAGPFDVDADHPVKDVRLVLGAPSIVRGVVKDSAGRPLENVRFLVTGVGPISDSRVANYDDEIRKSYGRGMGGTPSDGTFEFASLPPGQSLRIVALHPRFAPVLSGWFSLAPKETKDGFELVMTQPRDP